MTTIVLPTWFVWVTVVYLLVDTVLHVWTIVLRRRIREAEHGR